MQLVLLIHFISLLPEYMKWKYGGIFRHAYVFGNAGIKKVKLINQSTTINCSCFASIIFKFMTNKLHSWSAANWSGFFFESTSHCFSLNRSVEISFQNIYQMFCRVAVNLLRSLKTLIIVLFWKDSFTTSNPQAIDSPVLNWETRNRLTCTLWLD